MTPLDILTIYLPSIILNLWNIFFPWFKYKSYWQRCSYQRLWQTRWLRNSYRQYPWLSDYGPRLPSNGVYISQLVRFAMCCTCVSDFNSKTLQITSKLLTQVYRYHKLRKHLESFFGHTLTFCLNLVKYCFKNMFRKESLTRSSTVI